MARKLSREQRKSQRKRSARAEQRGLPALKVQKPSKPPASGFESSRNASSTADDEDERDGDVSEAEPARTTTVGSLIDQIKRLPLSVKLASAAALALALLWAFSLARKKDRPPEEPPAPSAAAPEGLAPKPPAVSPVPAEPAPTAVAPEPPPVGTEPPTVPTPIEPQGSAQTPSRSKKRKPAPPAAVTGAPPAPVAPPEKRPQTGAGGENPY